jgi:hypothetical protein
MPSASREEDSKPGYGRLACNPGSVSVRGRSLEQRDVCAPRIDTRGGTIRETGCPEVAQGCDFGRDDTAAGRPFTSERLQEATRQLNDHRVSFGGD